jgi:hypothetical protein
MTMTDDSIRLEIDPHMRVSELCVGVAMKADRSLRVFSFSSRRYQPDQVTSWPQSSNCRVLPVEVELAALG